MKRKIILFFTAIITVLMLTACSGGVDNAKQGKYYLNGDTSRGEGGFGSTGKPLLTTSMACKYLGTLSD